MSNPGEFLQACAAGKIWLYCATCRDAKNLNLVKHLDCIANPSYWGNEPWWHDIRVFNCPDCSTQQQSQIEYHP
ncbi:MAG: hypothetical protein R6V21_01580 [Pelovirga sp.]